MRYIPQTNIEIINPRLPCSPLRHVLFDFDGTISLIREGWQQVMTELMVELLQATPEPEDEVTLRHLVTRMIAQSTGQPTIDQMAWLVPQVARRGGQTKTAQAYKEIYLNRLTARTRQRLAALARGQVEPAELAVPGVLDLLAELHHRGVSCSLASGTERESVIQEAEALGVAPYFEGRIYGPQYDGMIFSKQKVIQQILHDNSLPGCELVSFGDGQVEIEFTFEVGGVGVGVASNEAERQGINQVKRRHLIEAGASIIIPDFREGEALLNYLDGNR